jgi:hypothetical protein
MSSSRSSSRILAAAALAATIAGCSAAGTTGGLARLHTAGHRYGYRTPAYTTSAAAAALPASSTTVQRQPAPGSCHARGSGLWSEPDLSCTPGTTNPAVTQATIGSTICRSGWTRTVRPPESVTQREKRASLAAYGDPGPLSGFEYDHDISLELGGATNDPRNLWPEPGETNNPKDALENALKALTCRGAITLATAQQLISTDWVAAYQRYVGPVNGR